jgi:hypothetical protein
MIQRILSKFCLIFDSSGKDAYDKSQKLAFRSESCLHSFHHDLDILSLHRFCYLYALDSRSHGAIPCLRNESHARFIALRTWYAARIYLKRKSS